MISDIVIVVEFCMISGSKGGIAGHLGDGDLLGRPLHQLHPTNCAQVKFFDQNVGHEVLEVKKEFDYKFKSIHSKTFISIHFQRRSWPLPGFDCWDWQGGTSDNYSGSFGCEKT